MRVSKHHVVRLLATFTLTFVGLNLLASGAGHALVSATCDLGNAAFGAALGPDVRLHFDPGVASEQGRRTSGSWPLIVTAQRPATGAWAQAGFDLRKALWIPVAVFLALTLASAAFVGRRVWLVLVVGTAALQIPAALLIAISVIAACYERYVIDLSDAGQGAVRFGYALLAPPGIAYATPLLLWASLMFATVEARVLKTGLDP